MLPVFSITSIKSVTYLGATPATTDSVRPSRMNSGGSKPVTQSLVQAPHSIHSYMVSAVSASSFMPRVIMLTSRPLARGVLVSLPVTSCTGQRWRHIQQKRHASACFLDFSLNIVSLSLSVATRIMQRIERQTELSDYESRCYHLARLSSARAVAPFVPRRPFRQKRRKHEAFRRVFPKRPSFPLKSRALWARCGVQGGERKRVSSGHNRRRRLATGSRQPKRGFDTAVSKTTIEVADHYPCQGDALDPFRVPWVQLLRLSPRENYRPSL